jgi:glycosyltransferase involved in cell wall biosynthesis
MRIGIDARLFGTRHGGIGRYSEQLIKNLEKIDQTNEYYIFVQKSEFESYTPTASNFHKVRADFKPYGIFEQLLFPFLLYKYRLKLVHFTHFNVPLIYQKKFIVTIHDLIISHYPDSRATTLPPLIYKIKLLAYNWVVKSTARRAKKIIAVSQFTKNDIVKFLKVKAEKITVCYEGVDLPEVSEVGNSEVLNRLGIGREFLLYVGSAYPHKNLEKLILAFLALADNYPDLQLVLGGKKNAFYEKLEAWLIALDNKNYPRIIFTDYLSDSELAALYASAKVYVFPSLIEGFGLPPLEAQTYGLPVVASDASCLPEVLGKSALYFDPNSIEEMTEKIKFVLDDNNLRSELIKNGKENLKLFSWEQMAQEIHDLY